MDMTLTEAMKTLKVLEKRMMGNSKKITEYASKVSTERPIFESDDAQRREVESLVQSNIDIEREYRYLKQCIEYTNLVATIEFDGENYTLSSLLVLKRKTGKLLNDTHRALNDSAASSRLRNAPTVDGKAAHVERLYDESKRNDRIKKLNSLLDNITIRLETVNATTQLQEVPR